MAGPQRRTSAIRAMVEVQTPAKRRVTAIRAMVEVQTSPPAPAAAPTVFELRPVKIGYQISEKGLETFLELGSELPRLASIIQFIEHKLSQID